MSGATVDNIGINSLMDSLQRSEDHITLHPIVFIDILKELYCAKIVIV